MKTIQEYLREADRERLLDSLAYDAICDPHMLLGNKNKTIEEIQNACRASMNEFIEHLLSIDTDASDHMVLYLTETTPSDSQLFHEGKSLCLIDLCEIRKDIYASS